jgi:hypothetical protein
VSRGRLLFLGGAEGSVAVYIRVDRLMLGRTDLLARLSAREAPFQHRPFRFAFS